MFIEEALSEIAIKIEYKIGKKFNSMAHCIAYFKRVAKYTYINVYRKYNESIKHEKPIRIKDDYYKHTGSNIEEEEAETLNMMFFNHIEETLGFDHAQIVRMRYYDNLPFEVIDKKLNKRLKWSRDQMPKIKKEHSKFYEW